MNALKKTVCTCAIFLYLSLAYGCDKVIYLVKVNNVPNTFKFSEENWGGEVIGVEIFDSSYKELLWSIKAIDKIPVKHFIIKVGEVPKGFEQVVPDYNTQFVAQSGVAYIIGINANYKPPAWGGEISWIAD